MSAFADEQTSVPADDDYWRLTTALPARAADESELLAIEREPVRDLQRMEPGDVRASHLHGVRARSSDGAWLFAGRLRTTESRTVLSEIRILPWPWLAEDPGPVGIRAYQAFPLRTLHEAIQQEIAERGRRISEILSSLTDDVGDPQLREAIIQKELELAALAVGPYRRGAPTKRQKYEELARAYLDLKADGYEGVIDEQLSQVLAEPGKGPVPLDTIRRWRRKARREGFLTQGASGRRFSMEAGPNLQPPHETQDTPSTTNGKSRAGGSTQ